LDKKTDEKLWKYNMNEKISQVGPYIGGRMFLIPNGKVQGLQEKEDVKGSIVAFGLP